MSVTGKMILSWSYQLSMKVTSDWLTESMCYIPVIRKMQVEISFMQYIMAVKHVCKLFFFYPWKRLYSYNFSFFLRTIRFSESSAITLMNVFVYSKLINLIRWESFSISITTVKHFSNVVVPICPTLLWTKKVLLFFVEIKMSSLPIIHIGCQLSLVFSFLRHHFKYYYFFIYL